MLSARSDDAYVKNATDAGAAGFLWLNLSTQHVCRAIRGRSAEGKNFFLPRPSPGSFTARNPLLSGSAARFNQKAADLTSREMEVLQLIAEGKANKQTASELGIGVKTVEKHWNT